MGARAATEPAEPRCLYGGLDMNADGVADMIEQDLQFDESTPRFGRVLVYPSHPTQGYLAGGHTYTLSSGEPNDLFGFAAATAGDVNGDGKHDIIVGAHYSNAAGARSGKVYIFSGADASTLFTFTGEAAGDGFGYAVSTAEDADGDGRDDVLIGSPWHDANGLTDCGKVYCYSGTTGALLWSRVGEVSNRLLGCSVSRLGNVDAVAGAEVLVGGPGVDDPALGAIAGRALVLHGPTGAVRFTTPTIFERDLQGYCVARAGDIDDDGVQDFLVCAPNYLIATGRRGVVTVYSGATNAVIRQHFAPQGARFGIAARGVRDFDFLDGKDDYEIASAGYLPPGLTSTPAGEPDPPQTVEDRFWVRRSVYHGAQGVEIYTVLRFPFREDPGSDVDGDGVVTLSDVETLVGSWGMQVCCGSSSGDVDGDGGVGSNDLSIILAEFGALGDSETCDVVECGPEGGLGPLQKCRRAANRQFFRCVQYDTELVLIGLAACITACTATGLVFPPAAPWVCHTCWRAVVGGGAITILVDCGRNWWHQWRACSP